MADQKDPESVGVEEQALATRQALRERVTRLVLRNEERLIAWTSYGLTGGDRFQAEDLVADGYIRLWQALLKERYLDCSDDELVSLLFTIIRRRFIDLWRRQRDDCAEGLMTMPLDQAGPWRYSGAISIDIMASNNVEAEVMSKAMAAEIDRQVRAVASPTQRQVYELVILQGQTHDEAAVNIGTTRNAVTQQLFQLRRKCERLDLD